ncbi:MAG: universal stress protein [Cytophagales bacterium]|nr:universal stress protein [Cytophagales bacterium]
MFHKILVPVDFSSCSINALTLASNFAKDHKISITVLNIFSLADAPSGFDSNAEKDFMKNLYDLEEKIPSLKEVDRKFEVEFGLAADVVVDKSNDYDLIIMGTRGKHDVIDRLIGSVSLRVIENAKVPVLVIPGVVKAISFAKIVFAADFKKIKHMSVLDSLRELALAYDSELHLLNVNESPEYLTEAQGEEAMALHQFFKDVNHAFFFSRNKDIEEGILSYTNEKSINVLALMPRKHSFLKSLFHRSTTGDVAMRLNSALFTFHE